MNAKRFSIPHDLTEDLRARHGRSSFAAYLGVAVFSSMVGCAIGALLTDGANPVLVAAGSLWGAWSIYHLVIRPRPTSYTLILISAFCFQLSAFAGAPTAGSGAADLIAPKNPRIVSSAPGVPPVPSVLAVVVPVITNTFYFAATASDTNGLFSDYSDEVSWSTTNDQPTVTLAWDSPLTNDPRYTYQLHTGGSSRTYTNTTSAGTNLTLHLTLYAPAPPPLTNRLVQVTTVHATNLQWSTTPKGPWTLLNATNWTATNPPAARYFRPMGRRSTPGQATIKQKLF